MPKRSSRKEKRKQARVAKRQKRNSFASKKKTIASPSTTSSIPKPSPSIISPTKTTSSKKRSRSVRLEETTDSEDDFMTGGDYPEDAEIEYLEKKLFAGKYKGEKGKKKLEKEWIQKDGFDTDFGTFLVDLDQRVFQRDGRSKNSNKKNSDSNQETSPMRNEHDRSSQVEIYRPRALSKEVHSEEEEDDEEGDEDDDEDDNNDNDDSYEENDNHRDLHGRRQSSSSRSNTNSEDEEDDEDSIGYGLIRSRSNSIGQQEQGNRNGNEDGENADNLTWGGVAPALDEKNEEFNQEETPEDAEIRYLEQKLFAGKYKGEKGKKKLEKEWAEKDGFDSEFASFIMGLGSGKSAASARMAAAATSSSTTLQRRYGRQEEMEDGESSISEDDDQDDPEDEEEDDNVVNLYSGRSGKKLTNADIYGQTPLNNDQEGNKPQKYVPPHMRNKSNATSTSSSSSTSSSTSSAPNTVEEQRLQRQVNGLFNRCGEDNIESIANAIHKLYSTHPNSLVNASFAKAVLNACGDLYATRGNGIQLLEPLVRNAAALTSALNFMASNGVHSVGPIVIEEIIKRCVEPLGWATALSSSSPSPNSPPSPASSPASSPPPSSSNKLILSLEHNKAGNNLILLISYLYVFGAVECTLIYDIVRIFATRLLPIDVELLLLMMTAGGMKMRSDDPSSLKEIILLVQKSVQRVKKEKETEMEKNEKNEKNGTKKKPPQTNARMDYMLDTLYDLKNNKTRSRKNSDRETTIKLNKWLRHMKTKTSSYVQPLSVTLQDIVDAETRGRWWIAGARWTGRRPENNNNGSGSGSTSNNAMDSTGNNNNSNSNNNATTLLHASIHVNDIDMDSLSSSSSTTLNNKTFTTDGGIDILSLAQAQRMNTDVRRSIFATIMSSSDYMDAFEKTIKLNLREKQEREIVYVLLSCCEDEPTYNPFYSHVAHKFCTTLPRFKFTFQLAFWDRFKLLTGSTSQPNELIKINHAARLLSFLFVRFSLSLSILKVIDFGNNMNDDQLLFFHSMSIAIFTDPLCVGEDDDVGIERMDAGRQGPTFDRIRKIFTRIGTSTEHQLVRSGLSYFLKTNVVDRLTRQIRRLKSGKSGSSNKKKRKGQWLECVLQRRRAKAALNCLDKVSIDFD